MRFPIAANLAAESLRDALRLAVPAHRLLAKHRFQRLGRTNSQSERDFLIRSWGSQVLKTLDVRVDLSGLEHVDPCGPYLVLPLHEGLVDVPLLLRLPLPMTFVARADLANQKPLDRMLEPSGQILINPEAPSALRVLLREAVRLQAVGRSVVVFPQGSVLGIETAFQQGACAVAERLGLDVLPVVIAGSHRVWDYPFSPVMRRQVPVHMRVLAPRPIANSGEFRALEREMKHLALSNTVAAVRHYVPERDGYWDDDRFDIDPDFADLHAEVASHRNRIRRAKEATRGHLSSLL
ncbi:MAG: 1-acyl-sn-glycerol-3-phosphate acyltransferase [bacterium]|nr:1-acyl-sn-glycerol-3-phosphate acyltransferase [bacterium]